MNYFKARLPNFIEYDEKLPELSFDDDEELLNFWWFAEWSSDKTFSHFAHSWDDSLNCYAVMAVLDDGYTWFVIGYIDTLKGIDWPVWEPKIRDET